MLFFGVLLCNKPELRSRPGLKARLLTLGESLSQQMVLETLVLKFPSNLKYTQTGNIWEIHSAGQAHLLVNLLPAQVHYYMATHKNTHKNSL